MFTNYPVQGLKYSLLLLCLSLVLGCTSKPATQPTSSQTSSLAPMQLTAGMVEPGVGTKEVKLGQTRAEVEQALGTPSGQDRNEFVEGQTYLLFHQLGIELSLLDDKVEMITLHSKNKDWTGYSGATADGIGVTSTAKEVIAAFGESEEMAPRALRYPVKGIVFRFDQDREGDGSNARAETMSIVPTQI